MDASTSRPPTEPDPLVDALERRLRGVDLIGWAQITARAEERGLSLEDLRMLLALLARGGASSVSDLAGLSGLSAQAAHRTVNHLRGRGYLHEDRRQYSLSAEGQDLVASLEAAHREGVQTYVEGLDPADRQRLEEAVRNTRS
jgi:DNA-binding MarR family transcriptional regulator